MILKIHLREVIAFSFIRAPQYLTFKNLLNSNYFLGYLSGLYALCILHLKLCTITCLKMKYKDDMCMFFPCYDLEA